MGGSCSSLSPAGCRLVTREEIENDLDKMLGGEVVGKYRPPGGYLTRRQRMLFHDPEAYERRRARILSTPLPGGPIEDPVVIEATVVEKPSVDLRDPKFGRIRLALYSVIDRLYRK
ncbi:hypothetical protein HOD38_00715 [archaeon]|jgi:hypothetical protein|nr:hypothetical protein [archaeon]MBT4396767.1 hypothetical protein [archaeon]MBT4441377.1 hypothetical protein [archaeon]